MKKSFFVLSLMVTAMLAANVWAAGSYSDCYGASGCTACANAKTGEVSAGCYYAISDDGKTLNVYGPTSTETNADGTLKETTTIPTYAFIDWATKDTSIPGVENVNITGNVISIGPTSFYHAPAKNITLPETVQTIEPYAFYTAELTEITIPASVTTFGDYSFYGASNLTNINFGENSQLTTIGDGAFQKTYALSSIELPDSVRSVGQFAFAEPYTVNNFPNNLDTIILNEGLQEIGSTAFSRANATSIVLPASLFEGDRELNPYLFIYSNIKTIYCPEGNQKCLNYVAMSCEVNDDINSEGCRTTTQPMATQPHIETYTVDGDGLYVLGGKRYTSFADMSKGENGMMLRRIYTVDEARQAVEAAGSDTVHFRIRYR